MMYLAILLLVIVFAGIAMTVNEGLWSNTVTLLAIWLAGVIATLLGPALGAWALAQFDKEPEFGWYFLFAGMWIVFFVAVNVIRISFDRISRVRVRFIPQLDTFGGPLMGVFVAVMFGSFCAYTLMKAPIAAQADGWNISQASGWVQSTFQYLEAPFYNLDRAWDGEELNFGA